MKNNIKKLKILEEKTGHKFKNPSALEHALTHESYVNEAREKGLKDYERLEFLGDAVLNQTISHILFENYPEKPEGWLSKTKALLVSKEMLAGKAKAINLGQLIRLGKGEIKSGGRKRPSILADCYESLLGALFLDGGYKICKKFISKQFKKDFDLVLKEELMDFKTKLQELTQELYQARPVYELAGEKGPLHKQIFHIKVTVNGNTLGHGFGKTKKEAGQLAAKEAVQKLKKL